MRLLLDANVLISAVAGRGLCEAVVEFCLEGHEIVVSEPLLSDIRSKLLGKLRVPAANVNDYCQVLREQGSLTVAAQTATDLCRDPDDLHLLGLAESAAADFLITGDKDLLVIGKFGPTQIVTPRQFWDRIAGL